MEDDDTAVSPRREPPGDESAEASGDAPAVGQTLAGRFALLQELGRGSYGRVFRAHDQLLDRAVAVKILLDRPGPHTTDRDRFLSEARAIARLDHAHVVPLYDAGVLPGRRWLAMRLVEGRSLSSLLLSEQRLAAPRMLDYLRQMVSALDHAHRRGLVHRDVKPSNIVVEQREGAPDHVWLLDFGMAGGLADQAAGNHGAIVGTPSYMAPEQISGRRLDPRADLFAAACVAHEMVTGLRAFPGESFSDVLAKVVHAPPQGLSELDRLAGTRLGACIRRALAKSPEDRPPSAAAFLRELDELATARGDGEGSRLRALLRHFGRGAPEAGWDGRDAVVAAGLAKAYRRASPALSGLDLSVPTGCVFALLGSNGSGKTTLLRTVVGLYAPDSGSIRVFGRDPRRTSARVLTRVGYVPELPVGYPGMRVREMLELLRGSYPTWDRVYCYRLLARFDLPLDARLRDMSRGVLTKVSVVAALGHRPELLVLDDPTLGLDAVVLREFFDVLRETSRREGTTVLVASHHLDELEAIATHVAFLKGGRNVVSGRLADLQGASRWIEARWSGAAPQPSPIPGFRWLATTDTRVAGITLERPAEVPQRLRALGADDVTTRPPTLKELFLGTLGHDVADRPA